MAKRARISVIVALSAIVLAALVSAYLYVLSREGRTTAPAAGRVAPLPGGRQTPPGAGSTTQPEGPPSTQPVGVRILPPEDETLPHPVSVGGKFGYIDNRGSILIAATFEDARPFDGQIAPVRSGGKWGVIDRTGQWIVLPTFVSPPAFHDQRAPIYGLGAGGAECGYADQATGQIVTAALFEDGRPFRSGLAAAKRGGRWGFITTTGRWFIQPRYGYARNFSDFKAAVWVGGKMGYVEQTGRQTIPAAYDVSPDQAEFSDFHENRAAVRTVPPDKWGYIDRGNAMVVAPRFDAARPFSEGLAAVKLAGQWGFIDADGVMRIAPAFADVDCAGSASEDYAGGFHGGLAAVRAAADAAGRWGFIDRDGRWVIPARYKQARSFRSRLAQVVTDEGAGYVDKTGAVVFKPSN